MKYDLIIIGGGPAGLTAGIYAVRAGLKTVLLEKLLAGGQVNNTAVVENFLGFKTISGMNLAEEMVHHTKSVGLEIIEREEVKEIEEFPQEFVVRTARQEYRSSAVILAGGAGSGELGVSGEKEFKGKGVSYCAVCDGPLYRGKEVIVVGGGNSAVEEADFLSRFVSKVYLIHRRDALRADKIYQDRIFKNPKIEILWNSVLYSIEGGIKVERAKIKNVGAGNISELACEGIFIYVGIRPEIPRLIPEVRCDDKKFIITNEKMETSIEGLFAAGDIRSTTLRQILTAAGNGAVAAHSAGEYVRAMVSHSRAETSR